MNLNCKIGDQQKPKIDSLYFEKCQIRLYDDCSLILMNKIKIKEQIKKIDEKLCPSPTKLSMDLIQKSWIRDPVLQEIRLWKK